MRRFVFGCAAIGLLSLGATVAQAQRAHFGLGGGLIVPTGDYNTLDKTGWHVLGKVDIRIPLSPIGVRVDGMYGQTSHRSPATGNTKLAGGTADVVWRIPMSRRSLRGVAVWAPRSVWARSTDSRRPAT